MRIAIFIKSTTFSSSYGGLETQNKILAEGLASRGHEVVVFTPKIVNYADAQNENGVEYKFVNCKVGHYSSLTIREKDSWTQRSYEEFQKENDLKKFDLVLGQSSGALGVIKHKSEFNLPIISISHGTKIGEFQTKFDSDLSPLGLFRSLLDLPHVLKNFFTVQREFIHGSNKIIAVSTSVKKSLLDETFVDDNKIVVINNAIVSPIEVDSPKYLTNVIQTVRLLYVGQLLRSKGIGRLAEMLLDSDMTDFTLSIIGSGELLSDLKEIEKKSNNRIKVHGKLPYSEVLQMYSRQKYDVFVFPTARVEGFPMVLVEAMFAGLPVVAFDLGGVSDAVADGKTGYLIKAGRFDLFKKALINIKNNPKILQEMGETALKTANERFSLDKMLDSYELVFQEVRN